MITNATYAGSSNTIVYIEPDNINVSLSHQGLVDWIGTGGIINPYEEDIELTKESKVVSANSYAIGLIHNAYSNPIEGVEVDATIQRNVMSLRRNNKANKLAGEIALTQAEKDESKVDQKLSEYELKVLADADKVIANINKLDTVEEVNAFDITVQNWNMWVAPL